MKERNNKYIRSYNRLQEVITTYRITKKPLERKRLLQYIKDVELLNYTAYTYSKTDLQNKLINLELVLEDLSEKEERKMIKNTIKLTEATIFLHDKLMKVQ